MRPWRRLVCWIRIGESERVMCLFFFSSRRRHTRCSRDWSSDVCSSDLERVAPAAAIPGGEITIRGRGFVSRAQARPVVHFGDAEASLSLASENRLIARVPEGANGGAVRVASDGHESSPHPVHIGIQIADNLHPVANPAVDHQGNIYVTFSGPRGQHVPVSLYKIAANYDVKPFLTSLVNPAGLALDREGSLFVSCRNDGTIHRVTPEGRSEPWIEGDRKSTRLNSSHGYISYAVFCLKKKKIANVDDLHYVSPSHS